MTYQTDPCNQESDFFNSDCYPYNISACTPKNMESRLSVKARDLEQALERKNHCLEDYYQANRRLLSSIRELEQEKIFTTEELDKLKKKFRLVEKDRKDYKRKQNKIRALLDKEEEEVENINKKNKDLDSRLEEIAKKTKSGNANKDKSKVVLAAEAAKTAADAVMEAIEATKTAANALENGTTTTKEVAETAKKASVLAEAAMKAAMKTKMEADILKGHDAVTQAVRDAANKAVTKATEVKTAADKLIFQLVDGSVKTNVEVSIRTAIDAAKAAQEAAAITVKKAREATAKESN